MIKTGKNKGFTLIELLIVIAIIALLMAILIPALSRAKEQGKRAVCLTHIKQLQLAWNMYVDDNDDKIPAGDVWFSWGFPGPPGPVPQLAWHEWPHSFPHALPPNATTNHPDRNPPAQYSYDCVRQGTCKQPDWYHAIDEGTMWRYIKDYRIYQCPVGDKGEFVTYAMSHSMNTYPNSGGTGTDGGPTSAPIVRKKSQIRRIGERMIFLDAGVAKQGAFFTPYTSAGGLLWGDPPPARHGIGTTFSFGDGHAIYRKWTDKHALAAMKAGWGSGGVDNCDCDLRWFSRATWGSIYPAYTCATPGKRCDEY